MCSPANSAKCAFAHHAHNPYVCMIFLFILLDARCIHQSIHILLFRCSAQSAHKMHPFLCLFFLCVPFLLSFTLFRHDRSVSSPLWALCVLCALVQIGAHIQCSEFTFCFPFRSFFLRLLFYKFHHFRFRFLFCLLSCHSHLVGCAHRITFEWKNWCARLSDSSA